MNKKKVIYDGDMGGDDLWAIAMLLAHRDECDLLGIASVFGNVSQPYATKNLLDFLFWISEEDIEVIQGADLPCDGMRPFGDDAYGTDGVGGVIFPPSPLQAKTEDIADWYHAMVCGAEGMTILATGPATNIALYLQKYPKDAAKIGEIIFMGGGIDVPGHGGRPVLLENGDKRCGNITPYAEFNAYQDPKALNIVLNSGAPLTVMAADATQKMVLTKDREARIKTLDQLYAPAFHRMLMVVADLDTAKFGVDGPFIHDPNVVCRFFRPDFYTGRALPTLSFTEALPDDERRGQAIADGGGSANVLWLDGVPDAEAVFQWMFESLETIIGKASGNRARLEG